MCKTVVSQRGIAWRMPQTVLFYRNNALSFSLAAIVSLSVHVFDFKLLMNPSHRYTA